MVNSAAPAPFLNGVHADPTPPGLPPNFGQSAIPHVLSFSGVLSSISRVYRASDEALMHAMDNARFMLNDPMLSECVEQRQRSSALLNWSLEPEDEKNSAHKGLAQELTAIIQKIPRFMQYRENLMRAIWFGRQGALHRWVWKNVNGKNRLVPGGTARRPWTPLHGDKIVFRYDDGTFRNNPAQIGIRVGPAYQLQNSLFQPNLEHKVQPTDWGMAYFLDPWQESLIAIHKHMVEDGEFEAPQNAGRIHGVGIRSKIYWTWYQKQEALAWMMEYLERSAFGIELWFYPMGNAEAEAKTRTAAQERIGQGRNIVLVPRPLGEESMAYGVERIEPGLGGVESLHRIITELFGHQMKRYILGQTLTTEASNTGLGSNTAEIHLDTYLQIVKYDSTNLEETLTTELVEPIQRYNFPKQADVPIRFKIATEEDDVEQKLSGWEKAFNMGLALKASELRDVLGTGKPDDEDEVLSLAKLQQASQPQQPGAPSTFGPMAGKGDADAVYSALQSEKDARALEQGLGIQQSQDSARSPLQLSAAGDVNGGTEIEAEPNLEGPDALRAAIAKAAGDTDIAPTEGQKAGGNYRKGRFKLHGLSIALENPAGSVRCGTSRDGKAWSQTMPHHYGYIHRTEGADADHCDCFVGPDPESELVYVVDQFVEGKFDEHKCLLGFRSAEAAKQAYQDSYAPGWKGLGALTPMTVAQFKAWLKDGDTSKPLAKQVARYAKGFVEQEHPRDQGGQFTSGGESSSAADNSDSHLDVGPDEAVNMLGILERDKGVKFRVNNGQIQADKPGNLSETDIRLLRANKQHILAHLGQRDAGKKAPAPSAAPAPKPTQSQTPKAPAAPASPASSGKDNLADVGNAARGIADAMYDSIWEQATTGKWKIPGPLPVPEQLAAKLIQGGMVKNRDEMKAALKRHGHLGGNAAAARQVMQEVQSGDLSKYSRTGSDGASLSDLMRYEFARLGYPERVRGTAAVDE